MSLEGSQVTMRLGIPVTTVARTIADLERSGAREDARRARRQADFLGLDYDNSRDDRTASPAEAALLALCARHRLPPPEVNVRVGPYVVDFLWRDAMLVVEIDGYTAHRGRSAFEEDRRRDLCLSERGHTVHRLSARQLAEQPAQIARLLRRETRIGN